MVVILVIVVEASLDCLSLARFLIGVRLNRF
jgi:hypothetical protein